DVTVKRATCFYCDEPFSGKNNQPSASSIDHVIPRCSLQVMTEMQKMTANGTNSVQSCVSCNLDKGRLMPLDWLVIMPSPAGAERLANRLRKVGFHIVDISQAMSRRKAPP